MGLLYDEAICWWVGDVGDKGPILLFGCQRFPLGVVVGSWIGSNEIARPSRVVVVVVLVLGRVNEWTFG